MATYDTISLYHHGNAIQFYVTDKVVSEGVEKVILDLYPNCRIRKIWKMKSAIMIDNLRLETALEITWVIIKILGETGWEPFAVNDLSLSGPPTTSSSYYHFRRQS
jgi:hypothetical protein